MNGYAILHPRGTHDAGVWSLIEQVEPGEWQIIARGAQADLARLAGRLNGPAELAAAEPTDTRELITRDEVLSWTEREYMEARGRLWLEYRGKQPDWIPHYFDGEHGREYSGPAGDLMTGSAHEFTRAKDNV